MNLPVFLSVLGIILIISFVLTTCYQKGKNNLNPQTNTTSLSLKSLAFIQFTLTPLITYIAVTQVVSLYLFLFYAATLVISGLGFFHRSKFWGYYCSLFFSFVFLILSISFGKNYFQQANNAVHIMYIVCVLYAFSLNILLLTIYKSHFLHNTVAYFKNPFKLSLSKNEGKGNASFKWIDAINQIKVSSTFAVTLIIFFFLYMFILRPLYNYS